MLLKKNYFSVFYLSSETSCYLEVEFKYYYFVTFINTTCTHGTYLVIICSCSSIHPIILSVQVAQQLMASGDAKLPDSVKDEKLQSLFMTSVEAKDKEDKVRFSL